MRDRRIGMDYDDDDGGDGGGGGGGGGGVAYAARPKSLRKLRACKRCKLVKTAEQFEDAFCENCPASRPEFASTASAAIKRAYVEEETTADFEGCVQGGRGRPG